MSVRQKLTIRQRAVRPVRALTRTFFPKFTRQQDSHSDTFLNPIEPLSLAQSLFSLMNYLSNYQCYLFMFIPAKASQTHSVVCWKYSHLHLQPFYTLLYLSFSRCTFCSSVPWSISSDRRVPIPKILKQEQLFSSWPVWTVFNLHELHVSSIVLMLFHSSGLFTMWKQSMHFNIVTVVELTTKNDAWKIVIKS